MVRLVILVILITLVTCSFCFGIIIESGHWIGAGSTGGYVSVGFRPLVVLVASSDKQDAVWRTDEFSVMHSVKIAPGGDAVYDFLMEFTQDGFIYGSALDTSGSKYIYTAFGDNGNDDIWVWNYEGDGNDDRQFTDMPFQPTLCMIGVTVNTGFKTVLTTQVMHDSIAEFTLSLDNQQCDTTNSIEDLLVNGVEIGTNGEVNSAGNPFMGFALGGTGYFVSGEYTGDAADPREMDVSTFKPELVIVKS